MPYQPIQLGNHIPDKLRSLVSELVDPALADFRFLLQVNDVSSGSKGSLQKPLAAILLSISDGAANFLCPGYPINGKRFKAFLEKNYPWEMDEPSGMSREDARNFLWDLVRCPLLHRFGALYVPNSKSHKTIKYNRIHSLSDDDIVGLETRRTIRPYTSSTIESSQTAVIFSIESFYWGLRMAIERSLDTPEKSRAVCEYIQSGKWDPTKGSSIVLHP